MNQTLKVIIAIIAIISGLTGIVVIVNDIKLVIGIFSLTFGILAIIWTSLALSSLSKGSSLKTYTRFFLLALIFIVLFSIWQTLGEILKWQELVVYPQYMFITIAYLIFVIASYNILKLGKEFGFKEKAQEINKSLKKN